MRTYYIVAHGTALGNPYWKAHRRGIWSTFNKFNGVNSVLDTYSHISPEDCEARLNGVIHPVKPKVVRVVRL